MTDTTAGQLALPTAPADFSPRTFEQALTFSTYLANSDLVPKDYKGKPDNCLIAMQWGAEIGLKPLQALSNIAVINGRASIWGDVMLALVLASPLCEYVTEEDDGQTAKCVAKRRGTPVQSRTFSIEDAKLAGLANKAGPWTQYPKRMRQMRARAFALRDIFPDLLRGLHLAEESMDINEIKMGNAEVVGQAAASKAEPERTEIPGYPQERLDANLEKWRGYVQAGTMTTADVIDRAETVGKLTDAQKTQIRNLAPIDADTGEVLDAGPAQADGQGGAQ